MKDQAGQTGVLHNHAFVNAFGTKSTYYSVSVVLMPTKKWSQVPPAVGHVF